MQVVFTKQVVKTIQVCFKQMVWFTKQVVFSTKAVLTIQVVKSIQVWLTQIIVNPIQVSFMKCVFGMWNNKKTYWFRTLDSKVGKIGSDKTLNAVMSTLKFNSSFLLILYEIYYIWVT